MYGFEKIGKVRPRGAGEIHSSRIGIGFEKLDRNLYDPKPCYDPIGELGAHWVRVQSGWCRTEKQKGVYDFSWLDEIVDALIARHTRPWMCLCYGNELYTPGANNKAGAVGRPPIHTEEERQGWDAYVAACVAHYRGRVTEFEIWNEPDGRWCWRPEPDPDEYSAFALRTAKVIKAANPDAQVLVGSFCVDFDFFYRFMTEELAAYTDAVTFHRYQFDVDNGLREHVRNIRAVLNRFDKPIRIIQGETGTQSEYSTHGALRCADWTERRQVKFLLREVMANLSTEVQFTSYFSMADIFENIQDDEGEISKEWYGFFGLLGETFDDKGKPLNTYRKKDAFYAMQTLCALFDDTVRNADLPILFRCGEDSAVGGRNENVNRPDSALMYQGFEKDNGARAFAYWKAADIMTTDFASSVSVSCYGLPGDVKLVDLYDGTVYRIPEDHIRRENGIIKIDNVPYRDYPLLLTFGGFEQA